MKPVHSVMICMACNSFPNNCCSVLLLIVVSGIILRNDSTPEHDLPHPVEAVSLPFLLNYLKIVIKVLKEHLLSFNNVSLILLTVPT